MIRGRRDYEDRAAPISILAGNKTPRPDTLKQTEQSQMRITLADGAGHPFKSGGPEGGAADVAVASVRRHTGPEIHCRALTSPPRRRGVSGAPPQRAASPPAEMAGVPEPGRTRLSRCGDDFGGFRIGGRRGRGGGGSRGRGASPRLKRFSGGARPRSCRAAP